MVLLAAGLSLGGCSIFDSSGDPTPVNVQIEVSRQVNVNVDGAPSPIVVRIYLLANKDAFSAAEFFDIYTREKQTMAADIVSSDEFELRPDEKRMLQKPDGKEAKFIAVLAAYRDITNAKWRSLTELQLHTDNDFVVRIGPAAVTIGLADE